MDTHSASGVERQIRHSENSSKKSLKLLKLILEVVILSSITIFVWSIFVAVPVVLYALPSVRSTNETTEETRQLTTNKSVECSEPTNYEGTLCSEELRQWQQCFSGVQTTDVLIPSNVDQQKAEDSASLLLSGIQFLSPSQECVAAIKPFMCLYLFGSCDYQNQLRQVSRSDCVELRDELCPDQWKAAIMLRGEGALPDCSMFEDIESQCLDTNGTSFDQVNASSDGTMATSQNLTCAQGFYVRNESSCRHLCSSWVNPGGVNADNIVTVASLVNAVLSSAIVVIATLTILRNELFSFPKYYLIYLCISTAFTAMIVLIGTFDREKLFCSSTDLIESFTTESAYCTINGIAYEYGVIQIGLWTLFFTLGICWGIFFPFHFQKYKSAQRFKYIHIVTLILGVLIPIIPVLTQVKEGYRIPEAPRRAICTGRNTDGIFYAFLLPFSILSAVITTLLVLIFWKILKELTLKKLSREQSSSIVGKAEAKVLCVTCYYVLTSCIIIVTFIYSLVTSDRNTESITSYLLCQSTGLQPDKQCGESPDVQLTVLNSLSTTSVFFQSYVPAVVLLFVAKYTCPLKSRKSPSRSRSTSKI